MENNKAKKIHNGIKCRVGKAEGYMDTTISDEFRKLENFSEWYDENYVEGWEVDKDILSDSTNKCYSHDTCLMVPREINALFRKSTSKYGKGVYFDSRDNKYYGQMRIDGKTKNCGSSTTAEGAHKLYLEQRKVHLQELLERYKDIHNQYAYQRLATALQQYL